MKARSRSQRGFSLLEVMASVAIFALITVAIMRSNTASLQASGHSELILAASVASENALDTLRALSVLPGAGGVSYRNTIGGYEFFSEIAISQTAMPHFYKIQVSTFRADDLGQTQALHQLHSGMYVHD